MSAGDYDDPKASSTVIVGIVGVILLLAIVVLAQVTFYNAQSFEDLRKNVGVTPTELGELQAEQLAQITTYRLIPGEERRVAIPIERAMKLYVAEVDSGQDAPKINQRDTGTPVASPESDG